MLDELQFIYHLIVTASHNRCRGSLSMLLIEAYMLLFIKKKLMCFFFGAHIDRKFWSSTWQIRY